MSSSATLATTPHGSSTSKQAMKANKLASSSTPPPPSSFDYLYQAISLIETKQQQHHHQHQHQLNEATPFLSPAGTSGSSSSSMHSPVAPLHSSPPPPPSSSMMMMPSSFNFGSNNKIDSADFIKHFDDNNTKFGHQLMSKIWNFFLLSSKTK